MFPNNSEAMVKCPFYHADNLERLRVICKRERMWKDQRSNFHLAWQIPFPALLNSRDFLGLGSAMLGRTKAEPEHPFPFSSIATRMDVGSLIATIRHAASRASKANSGIRLLNVPDSKPRSAFAAGLC